jgi:hypothetical protein
MVSFQQDLSRLIVVKPPRPTDISFALLDSTTAVCHAHEKGLQESLLKGLCIVKPLE